MNKIKPNTCQLERKSSVVLFFLTFGLSIVFGQKVVFSEEDSWVTQGFDLVLSTNGTDIIWYTMNGKKPLIGTNYTFSYTTPIPIYSLADSNYSLLNRLKDFTSDVSINGGGTSFYSQVNAGEYDFMNYAPALSDVPKKKIIRACAGSCHKIYTRSFGIGNFKSQGEWEIEIIFDYPNDIFDIDSGAYATGVGLKVPWFLSPALFGNNPFGLDLTGQPDSIWIENFRVSEKLPILSMPTVLNLLGFPYLDSIDIPSNWIENKALVLVYEDNKFIEELEAKVRPNGNGGIDKPLKYWKIKFDELVKDEMFFALTDNIILRPQTEGISCRLSNEISNLWKWGTKISRETTQSSLTLYNESFMEAFGSYSIFSSGDKKYAKKYWKMLDPVEAPFTSSSDGTMLLFTLANPNLIPDWYSLLQDTNWVYSQTRDELSKYIDMSAWIKYALHKSFIRSASSLNRESKVYFDKSDPLNPSATSVLKDDDNAFQLTWGGTTNPFNYNHLAYFTTLDSVYAAPEWEADDFDLLPHWAIRASLTHPENKYYYQNLLLDGFEQAYRYNKTKETLGEIIQEYNYNRSIYAEIESINNSMNLVQASNHFMEVDSFLKVAEIAILKDWIEFFHPGYTLNDTFLINVNFDNVSSSCFVKNSIRINSMEFESSGSRIHIRDFPVKIEALPSPGYSFSHWLEFPDSSSTFILDSNTLTNISITPFFTESIKMCDLQVQLKINEVMPWDTSGADRLEIYNPTNYTISFQGMGISDRVNSIKHVFDSASVDPLSYFVIEFQNNPTGGYLVDDFAINKEGESIYLFLHDSSLVDFVQLGASDPNTSYGYCNDSLADVTSFLRLDSATFGSKNTCEINSTNSIANLFGCQFKVYPNPAEKILFLESEIDVFIIYDALGSIIKSGGQVTEIAVSDLSSGFYVLQVVKNKKRLFTKFLKN